MYRRLLERICTPAASKARRIVFGYVPNSAASLVVDTPDSYSAAQTVAWSSTASSADRSGIRRCNKCRRAVVRWTLNCRPTSDKSRSASKRAITATQCTSGRPTTSATSTRCRSPSPIATWYSPTRRLGAPYLTPQSCAASRHSFRARRWNCSTGGAGNGAVTSRNGASGRGLSVGCGQG